MTPDYPKTTFNTTSVEVTGANLPRTFVPYTHKSTSKHVDTVTLFFKNLNKNKGQ